MAISDELLALLGAGGVSFAGADPAAGAPSLTLPATPAPPCCMSYSFDDYLAGKRLPRRRWPTLPRPGLDAPLGDVPAASALPGLSSAVFRRRLPVGVGPNQFVPLPCTAQCVNLQGLHPYSVRRLGLCYKKYFTITDFQVDPTPEHPGGWVKVLETGVDEWLPHTYFEISAICWPN